MVVADGPAVSQDDLTFVGVDFIDTDCFGMCVVFGDSRSHCEVHVDFLHAE